MKPTLSKFIFAMLICIGCLAMQSCSARDEKEVLPSKAAVNLMGTDLVKAKDLLDCQLRLEGKPPHYKLVYSLGEIEVPTLAVKKKYGDSHFLLAIKAEVSGLPVSELFVRYHDSVHPYRMGLNCPMANMPCDAPVAYAMLLDKPEHVVLSTLRSHYASAQVVDSTMSEDVSPRAVIMRDRPGLMTYAMDGLSGSDNKQKTYLHYVCATE